MFRLSRWRFLRNTPTALKNYQRNPDWRLPALAAKYPRLSTHRETADEHHLEWVTPGHPLFEAVRRHTHTAAQEAFKKGACFHSLAHDAPARIDFYRARVVDGLGHVIHERLFVVEVGESREPVLREAGILGDLTPAPSPPTPRPEGEGNKPPSPSGREQGEGLPSVAHLPEASAWLHQHGFGPFLDEVRAERCAEVERIAHHVEMSLTELLSRADDEIGRAAAEVEGNIQGAEGWLKQAEDRADCYWLYVVTNCNVVPTLEAIPNPARFTWHEVQQVAHYTLSLDDMRRTSGGGQ